MGIRRIRNTLIAGLLIIFSKLLYGMQVYVQPKDSSVLEKIFDGFLAAGPTLLLAFFSIKSERKKDEKNDEKRRIQAEKNLEKEWYNQIILNKLLDPLSEYFDYLEDNMESTENEILKETKNKRLDCLRKLSLLRIFDEKLYKNCFDKLLLANDNTTSSLPIRQKRIINKKLKNEIYQKLYLYIKSSH